MTYTLSSTNNKLKVKWFYKLLICTSRSIKVIRDTLLSRSLKLKRYNLDKPRLWGTLWSQLRSWDTLWGQIRYWDTCWGQLRLRYILWVWGRLSSRDTLELRSAKVIHFHCFLVLSFLVSSIDKIHTFFNKTKFPDFFFL